MVVKTITIKKNAYEALKSLKLARESFSDTILRIAKRKSLSAFFGILSSKTGEHMEKEIFKIRVRRNIAHKARIKGIVKAFKEV